MPFSWLRSLALPKQQVSFNPGSKWLLAIGRDRFSINRIVWQDEKVAIAGEPPAFSPQQRFAIAGDVWLSNRSHLQAQLPNIELLTDCQAVAHLWEAFGAASLEMLEGIWSLAIWDRELQQLRLIRDRLGGKTLFYTDGDATRYIAPRLMALAPFHNRELDLVALRDYLCCAFVPGARTLWQGVRELPPGTILSMPAMAEEIYWQPKEDIRHPEQPLHWHAQQLRSQLEAVVQEYLPSGEPVGIFLSGGIDSSCITALAAKLHNQPLHTYSVHFGLNLPNEIEFANLVAQQYQTQHHILEIQPSQLWEMLPQAMAHLGKPIGEGLTVPNLLAAQLAKQSVDVTLNGEGGDPCFGGPKNQPMLLNDIYNMAAAVAPVDPVSAYLASFKKCFADLPRLLQPEIWQAASAAPYIFGSELKVSDANYLNQLMLINIKFKGADYILNKVRSFTEASGLQGRSPLFDRRIATLSLQIPPAYKLAGAEEKAVLKQAVADLVPEAIIQRPKSGMMMPMHQWFRTIWRRQARDLLLNRQAAIAPYLNQALIKEWLDYRGQLWPRYGVLLWLLVTLEVWLQVHRQQP